MRLFNIHDLTKSDVCLLKTLSCDVYYGISEIKERFFLEHGVVLDDKTRGRLRTFEKNGMIRVKSIGGKHSKVFRRVRRDDVERIIYGRS